MLFISVYDCFRRKLCVCGTIYFYADVRLGNCSWRESQGEGEQKRWQTNNAAKETGKGRCMFHKLYNCKINKDTTKLCKGSKGEENMPQMMKVEKRRGESDESHTSGIRKRRK